MRKVLLNLRRLRPRSPVCGALRGVLGAAILLEEVVTGQGVLVGFVLFFFLFLSS